MSNKKNESTAGFVVCHTANVHDTYGPAFCRFFKEKPSLEEIYDTMFLSPLDQLSEEQIIAGVNLITKGEATCHHVLWNIFSLGEDGRP